MTIKKTRPGKQWQTMDLHIHTPASGDYQQPEATYLEILQRAETRGLDIIAFTDHNTVAGYRKMQEEIQQLELLKKLKRILPEEQARLVEYYRLAEKVLVLPAFEITTTFGFHVIGIFSPDKPVREIEHMLLDLNIPPNQLDDGSATVGATSDVLTAYRKIAEGGGIVIAAHANSSNGVAMRGFPLGGQTKIAYTQDQHLHAIEVTDLDKKGTGSSAAFFNGAKPEYPRRMHLVQGSDSHRLAADPQRKKNLGVGDRATDVLLNEVSFEALRDLFLSNDFARSRPHNHAAEPAFDFIRGAREEGPNIVQDFHESMTLRGGKRFAIISDICAFANTNGGTLYIGVSANLKEPIIGIPDPSSSLEQLRKEIDDRISPRVNCSLDAQETGGKKILRVMVPRGEDAPYALDENKIYIRTEAETSLAVRDEIVGLVLRNSRQMAKEGQRDKVLEAPQPVTRMPEVMTANQEGPINKGSEALDPRTGVELVRVEERNKNRYFTLRDLRNNNVVSNVTLSSARRLWHYAISTYIGMPTDLSKAEITWQGNYGLLRQYRQGSNQRFDLVYRQAEKYRCFFGVTEDGVHGQWRELLGLTGGMEED